MWAVSQKLKLILTFYLCIYLILNEEDFTFHLQYKHSGTFANCKCEELSYPKNPKMCDPILVTLLKMQPHYSQSSCENATPSSGTSSLASYKEPPSLREQNYDISIKLHPSVILGKIHLSLPLTPSIVDVGEGKPV